jgi:hypothetical protein
MQARGPHSQHFRRKERAGFSQVEMGIRQEKRRMRWPKDQSWFWRWSRLSYRHSVPPLRAAWAPAVHRPVSERRLGPRDLEYEARVGPSSPRQRRILLQPETPKRFRYRLEMRFQRNGGSTRDSRVVKCSCHTLGASGRGEVTRSLSLAI